MNSKGRVTLLSNAGAAATGSSVAWFGGTGLFVAAGTFGGGIVTLQFLGPDGSTWISAGSATVVVAAGGANFNLPPGQIRAVVTGSSSGMHCVAAHTGL